MASRKEYEMLFRLNAQLSGGYSSTFSKAQNEIAAMSREIDSLSKRQSDIAAFQKQQSAVENTRQKLAALQQQYDNIQREIQETGEFSSTLENRLISKQQQIDRTSASLQQQTQSLNSMENALREAGVDTDNLTAESAQLAEEINTLRVRQDEASEAGVSFGERASAAFTAIGSAIVAAGIANALHEIYDAYMECISVAGNFEASMSNVEALSGATGTEMSELTSLAKELGATTKFTAQESADAMGYMAMAGWDVNDMLSGMDGVLQLAAASGEDLAEVSDIVTDSMSAFGLAASDTAHYSDVLATAATKSNTNVSIMGETFKNSASVAGALGYSVEDVAIAVGLMANNGVKGSIAGTVLKNTFNGLLQGVTLTGKAFGEYEFSAIKADGTMKGFGATIDELRGYFSQMTEAERVNNAQVIAGERGYNGLLAILNATDADYTSLSDSINNCTGAAQRMADIKMDNLNGQLTLMDSAWEALKETIGEELSPAMRKLYSAGTDLFGILNDLASEYPALVKAITAFITVIGLATAGITAYVAVTKIAAALDLASVFAVAGPIMLTVGAIAALTAGIVGLLNASNEAVPSVKELTESARSMDDAIADAAATYEATASETMAAASVADTYIRKLEELEDAGLNTNAQQEQYHNTLALLCQVVPDLADSIDLETDTIEGGTAALRANTEAWKQNAMQQALQDQLTAMYQKQAEVLIENEENSIALTKAQYDLEVANKKYSDTIDRMNDLYEEAEQKAEDYKDTTGEQIDAANFLSQEYYDLENSLAGINSEISDAEGNIKVHTQAMTEDQEAIAAAQEEISRAEEAVQSLSNAMSAGAGSTQEATQQSQELNAAIEGVAQEMNSLTEKYNEAYEAALTSITGQYSLWDEADAVVAISADSINSALQSQISYWQDYNSNLQSLSQRTAEIEGLGDVIASFADGSTESVNAIAGMASASDEDLAAMVASWQNLQGEQDKAAGSVADLKTNFTKSMDDLQKDLEKDVKGMNLGPEAATAAKSTVQSYIKAANDMLPQVRAAYNRIAQAAQSALSSVNVSSSLTGYATGTQNAAPGFAIVGEEGPELVYFNGGEKVMNAQETAALKDDYQITAFAPQLLQAMSAYNSYKAASAENMSAEKTWEEKSVSVQIVFQIDGPVTSSTVDAMREYGDEFAEKVIEIVENAGIDITRRSYR